MTNSQHFEITSELRAPALAVWNRATSVEGIRDELWPWLRMTVPRGLDAESFSRRLTSDTLRSPVEVGRSWLLLLQCLPVEWDDIVIVQLEPGRGFLERSTMATMKLWQHERVIEPLQNSDHCRVTDRLTWRPRRLVPQRLTRRLVRTLFQHRHTRLVRRYSSAGAGG